MATRKKQTRRTVRKRATRKATPTAAATPVTQPPVVEAAPPIVERQMKSIWYMVGLVLTSMGALIFLTGIYLAFDPSSVKVAMGHLQPDLWWGAVMLVVGSVFIFTHRNKTHEV
jgi:hypothetical protein